jgi:hypothetical protein
MNSEITGAAAKSCLGSNASSENRRGRTMRQRDILRLLGIARRVARDRAAANRHRKTSASRSFAAPARLSMNARSPV